MSFETNDAETAAPSAVFATAPAVLPGGAPASDANIPFPSAAPAGVSSVNSPGPVEEASHYSCTAGGLRVLPSADAARTLTSAATAPGCPYAGRSAATVLTPSCPSTRLMRLAQQLQEQQIPVSSSSPLPSMGRLRSCCSTSSSNRLYLETDNSRYIQSSRIEWKTLRSIFESSRTNSSSKLSIYPMRSLDAMKLPLSQRRIALVRNSCLSAHSVPVLQPSFLRNREPAVTLNANSFASCYASSSIAAAMTRPYAATATGCIDEVFKPGATVALHHDTRVTRAAGAARSFKYKPSAACAAVACSVVVAFWRQSPVGRATRVFITDAATAAAQPRSCSVATNRQTRVLRRVLLPSLFSVAMTSSLIVSFRRLLSINSFLAVYVPLRASLPWCQQISSLKTSFSSLPCVFHTASSVAPAVAASAPQETQASFRIHFFSSPSLAAQVAGPAPLRALRIPSTCALVEPFQQSRISFRTAASSFLFFLERQGLYHSSCASVARVCSCSSSGRLPVFAAVAAARPASNRVRRPLGVFCRMQQQLREGQLQKSTCVFSSSSSFLSLKGSSSSTSIAANSSPISPRVAAPRAAAFASSLAGPQAAWSGDLLIEWLPQLTTSSSTAEASPPAASPAASFPPAASAAASSLPAASTAASSFPAASVAASSSSSFSSSLSATTASSPSVAAVSPAAVSGCLSVRLNRPRQLNALNLDMFMLLKQLLRAVDRDPRCSLLLLQGTGEKAFCAGGDVKHIHDAPFHDIQRFFGCEYAVDFLTSQLQKPYVALWRGIVMGGGVGLSCSAPYRICWSNTQWAMPETAIGLFPDVGISYFFFYLLEDRFPGLPLYIGLTGVKLKAGDLRRLGIATHYVRPERVDSLYSGLQAIPGGLEASAAHAEIQRVLAEVQAHEDPGEDLFVLSDEIIEGCRQFLSLQRIPRSFKTLYASLQQQAAEDSFCRLLLQELSGCCPLSCAVWQEMLLRVSGRHAKEDAEGHAEARAKRAETRGKQRNEGGMQLLQALEQDFRLVQAMAFIHSENFKEGVRAALVRKDKQPRW